MSHVYRKYLLNVYSVYVDNEREGISFMTVVPPVPFSKKNAKVANDPCDAFASKRYKSPTAKYIIGLFTNACFNKYKVHYIFMFI